MVIITTIEDGSVGYAQLEDFSHASAVKWIIDATEEKAEDFTSYTHNKGGLLTMVVRAKGQPIASQVIFVGLLSDFVGR